MEELYAHMYVQRINDVSFCGHDDVSRVLIINGFDFCAIEALFMPLDLRHNSLEFQQFDQNSSSKAQLQQFLLKKG